MGCQTEIVAQIIEQQADYLLALKANHGRLYQEVERLFNDALTDPQKVIPYQTHRMINKGHDRLEIRQCCTISRPQYLAYLDPQARWVGLQTVVRIEATRQLTGTDPSQEVRYYLSSLADDPERLNQVARRIGLLKTDCIGFSMSLLAKIRAECARVMPLKIWPSCATLLLTL